MVTAIEVSPIRISSGSSTTMRSGSLIGSEEPLRVEKPGGQLVVVAGRSHGDGDRGVADTDFERLFDHDAVGISDGRRGAPPCRETRRPARRRGRAFAW